MTQGFVNRKCLAKVSINTRRSLWGTFGDTQARRRWSRKAKKRKEKPVKIWTGGGYW